MEIVPLGLLLLVAFYWFRVTRLKAREELLLLIMQSLPVALLMADKNGMPVLMNERFSQLFGYLPEDLSALKEWWPRVKSTELNQPSNKTTGEKAIQAAATRNGSARPQEQELACKDGQTRYVEFSRQELHGNLLFIFNDITERKRQEQSRQQSEERFAKLFYANPVAMSLTRFDNQQHIDLNEAFARRTGLTRSQVLGKTFQELPFFADAQEETRLYQRLSLDNSICSHETTVQLSNSELRLLISAELITIAGEQWVLWAYQDITAEENIEPARAAGKPEEPRSLGTIEDQTEFIVRWRPDGTRTFVNDGYCRYFGLSYEEAIDTNGLPGAYTPGTEELLQRLKKLTPDNSIFVTEYRMQRPNGALSWTHWLNHALFDERGNLVEYQSVGRDITARKQMQERLAAARDEMRNLAAHLQMTREEERAFIAREIHDELGQMLTGIRMHLKWLERNLAPAATSLRARLADTLALVSDTSQAVRRIATQLRPPILDDFGLLAAIEWQVKEFQKHSGIACRVEHLPQAVVLDSNYSTAIFRIFQETLTNVARHAEATEVLLTLKLDDEYLWLHVQDNGRGITPDEIAHARSLGLVGMRERAQLLGGSFHITGLPGQGTTVTVKLPLQTQAP